jgi:hypothetical protein
MARANLETLRALNRDLFAGRWNDEDLRQLVAPSFGVVSSFESVLADLAGILEKDLGEIPPELPTAEQAK